MCKVEPSGQWGWQEVLLNKAVYLLEVLVWAKSKDATKKSPRNQPKPFIPDFIKKYEQKAKGETAMDIDDLKALLNKPRKKV